MHKKIKGISVILPSYNSDPNWLVDSTISCLNLKQTWDGNIEVIIVDDGSTNLSTKLAQDKLDLLDNVKLLRLDKNQGLPSALNQGILNSTYDWIARQDDDDV